MSSAPHCPHPCPHPLAPGGGDLLEELQLMAAQNLETLEVGRCYEVLRQLGRGTYGKVDLVVHRVRGTKMALKLLRKKTTKLKSFLREYSASLFLSPCPFIISTLGIAFQTHEHYVFAQEFALAGDLFDIIPPQVGLPEGVAKRCVHQVAMALDYLHARGLVHRDIKPENVLIFDRECRKVKLSDFGMTRRAGSPVKRVTGTIPYTAPELCGDAAPPHAALCVEYSTDVWAFGVLLFCMLTGNFPWEKALPADVFYDEFSRWQRRRGGAGRGGPGGAGGVPSQWRRFTDPALRMFRRLLAAEREHRCSVKEVFGHFNHAWMMDANASPAGGAAGNAAAGNAAGNVSGSGAGPVGPPGSGGVAASAGFPVEFSSSSSEEEVLVSRLKHQSLTPLAVVKGGVLVDKRYSSSSSSSSSSTLSVGGSASSSSYERTARDASGRMLVATPIEICV